jgi:hypothetical protein
MSNTNINNDRPENKSYLFQRNPIKLDADSAKDKFDVVVPKRNMIIIIGIFIGLFLAQFFYFSGWYYAILFPDEPWDIGWFYWWAPFAFLAISVVIIIAWGNIGSRFASASILRYLRKTVTKGKVKASEMILGYPMRTKDIYYLEAFPDDLDLGSSISDIKILIKRVLEVLFLSMGMSVVISQIVAPYIYVKVASWDPDLYFNIEEMIIDMTIYLGPFTLLILMLVMPVFWIAEDIQAYRITPEQDSVRLGIFLRGGLLSKILSFFGLVLVFNLAQEFATALVGGDVSSGMASSPETMMQIYITTLVWFALIIAMCSAIPFLVTLVYLIFYHERWVNNVRVQASEFMDVGTLEVRKPDMSKMVYLKKPEMIDETGGFFRTTVGRIILLLLIIISAIVCIYLSFILGFEEALL